MQNVLGIIFAESHYAQVGPLTSVRPLGALPVAGRYRIIDFTLSNMVNSGMKNIAIVTHNNYHSLMGHLGSGKQWNLARKRFGLTLFPPFSNLDSSSSDSRIDILYGVLGFLKRSTQDYVMLSESNIICNSTFNKMFEYHIQNQNDITVACQEAQEDELNDENESFLILDENNNITNVDIGGNSFQSTKKYFGFILISRQRLIDIIENSKIRGKKGYLNNIVGRNIGKLKIKAYETFIYARKISNVNNYFAFNMSVLNEDVRKNLFKNKNSIYTKEKDTTPTKYLQDAKISNSFIADGCVIDGTVENSIIFRGVTIKKGSVVKNSIILQQNNIGENVYLENVIIDKKSIVRDNKKLIGTEDFPVVVPKGTEI